MGGERLYPERFPLIAVFPQALADGTRGWQGAGGRAAMEAVDKAVKEFSGDPSRVYLTGLSAEGVTAPGLSHLGTLIDLRRSR